jgi:hypothetical protein
MMLVQALIRRGVDLSERSKDGSTPLHVAIKYRKYRIATELVGREANTNAQDNEGNTPLHHLYRNRFYNVFLEDLMLGRGANPEIANNSGLRCADLKLAWQIKDELGADDSDADSFIVSRSDEHMSDKASKRLLLNHGSDRALKRMRTDGGSDEQ